MHVQPEATSVKIASKPLWAPGAPEAVEAFIAGRTGEVHVLEFGSGGSTMFLLGCGATVTTVEHHADWADALQQEAETRGLAAKLTILRRDRPYHDVPLEFSEQTRFDVLLVDGRERIECLGKALRFVKPDGLVLLDDSQRSRYWPAFALLAAKDCVTYESKARNTSLWSLESEQPNPAFVRKSFVPVTVSAEPKAKSVFVPREFLDGSPIRARYARRKPISDLTGVEHDLQKLKLIERHATYIAPSLYELRNSSLRIEAGRKILSYKGAVYKEKSGEYLASDVLPVFEGAVDLEGRTLDLTSAGAGRYSFFLLDVLPKLEILRASGRPLEDFDTIVVNSSARWVRDMLTLALDGYKPKILSFGKTHPSFHMERSTHIDGIRSARFTPRWVHSYLERLFKDPKQGSDAPAAESFGSYVYISRQNATGRTIVNYDAFLDLIGSFGFREIKAEDYTPSQLAVKLRDVKVLISPHGAGLANVIFCPPSAKIIELFSSHFTPQYFHLARDMGQGYSAFPCRDAQGLNVFDRYKADTPDKSEFNREDIVVPIEELRQTLKTLC